jgi:DNA repair proteins
MEKKYSLDQVSIRMVREKPLYSAEPINTAEKAVQVLADAIRQYDREVVCIVNINSAMQPININICSVGSLNRSIVNVREMLKTSILSNAASVIMLHQHPSGNCEPSDMDIAITDKLQEAYSLMDIELLDHIIVGAEDFYSFAENKVLPDKKLSFTQSMEVYQLKHGIEAKKESVRKQLKDEVSMVGEKKTAVSKKNKHKREAR